MFSLALCDTYQHKTPYVGKTKLDKMFHSGTLQNSGCVCCRSPRGSGALSLLLQLHGLPSGQRGAGPPPPSGRALLLPAGGTALPLAPLPLYRTGSLRLAPHARLLSGVLPRPCLPLMGFWPGLVDLSSAAGLSPVETTVLQLAVGSVWFFFAVHLPPASRFRAKKNNQKRIPPLSDSFFRSYGWNDSGFLVLIQMHTCCWCSNITDGRREEAAAPHTCLLKSHRVVL